jgi:hypothetical protein
MTTVFLFLKSNNKEVCEMKSNKFVFTIAVILAISFLFAGCGIVPTPTPTKGTISGQVLVPPGASEMSKDISGWVPAGGAMVTVVDANGVSHTVEADEDGHYVFENLSVGVNTIITATVTIDGNTVVLKSVIDQAVSASEDYDAGAMTPESTALALVVETMIAQGVSPQAISPAEIQGNEDFAALVDEVTDVLETGGDVTESGRITNMTGNIADEVINPPAPPEPTPTVPVTGVSVEGDVVEGETLTAMPAPSRATVTYKWLRAEVEDGEYDEIEGATENTYILTEDDVDKYIKVKITGKGNYRGTVSSDPVEVKYPTLAQYIESNTTVLEEYTLTGNADLEDPAVGANKTVALNGHWVDIGGTIDSGGFTITSTGGGTVMFGQGFSITGSSLGDIIIVNTDGAASYELATGATIPDGYEWQPVGEGRPRKFVMLPIQYDKTGGGFGYSNTISEAITNVIADGTILVGAGTYTETGQIVIAKNLSINGMDKDTTIIKPAQDTGDRTSGDNRGWFLVNENIVFNLSNVTLNGEGYKICVAVCSKGNGTIEDNIFKNISHSPYFGWGIDLDQSGAGMTIKNNQFINIERLGVQVKFGNGTQIISNTFTGNGDGDYLQYGIEVNRAPQNVLIDGNTFTHYGTSTTEWESGAIFVDDAFQTGIPSVTITNNTITNNEVGIYHGSNRSWPEILDVEITGNQFTDNGRHVVDDSNDDTSAYVLDLDAVLSGNSFPDGKAQVVDNTIQDVD